MLALLACLVSWGALCLPASASAPAVRAHLVWQTPAGRHCIVQRELERGVEVLLARDVFVPSDRADDHVDGSILPWDGGWLAKLALRTRTGQVLGARELFSPETDCEALNRVLIVVLATLIDTPAEREGSPSAAAAPAGGFGFGLAAAVSRSVLPATAVGAAALAMFAPAAPWPAFWLEVQGFLPQKLRDKAGHGGSFQPFQALVSVCPALLHLKSLAVSACAGIQLGWLRGSALGLTLSHSRSRLTAGLLLEPAVSLRLLPHLSARLSAGLSIALERPEFYFSAGDGSRQKIYRPELFGARVGLAFIVDGF